MTKIQKLIGTLIILAIAAIGLYAIAMYSAKAIPDPALTASSTPSDPFASSTVSTPASPTGTGVSLPSVPAAGKPFSYGQVVLALGERAIFPGGSVTPARIVEDSRCPSDVRCIQAGTVRLSITVGTPSGLQDVTVQLGESATVDGMKITFSSVTPEKLSTVQTASSAYRFILLVEKAAGGSAKQCFVGGCSSEICSDTEGMVSTCMYRAEYGCYRTAKCERQPSGSCGWTETASLKACRADAASGASEPVY